jgi:hypothetical protein
MEWIGPFTINHLLDDFSIRPPEDKGIYVISKESWSQQPTPDCQPLYIGSNTGASKRFRTRIGDLIADMFGFFVLDTHGHHSGGKSLYGFCEKNNLNPKNLYIAWIANCNCVRCAENEVFDRLRPRFNKRRPNKCKKH